MSILGVLHKLDSALDAAIHRAAVLEMAYRHLRALKELGYTENHCKQALEVPGNHTFETVGTVMLLAFNIVSWRVARCLAARQSGEAKRISVAVEQLAKPPGAAFAIACASSAALAANLRRAVWRGISWRHWQQYELEQCQQQQQQQQRQRLQERKWQSKRSQRIRPLFGDEQSADRWRISRGLECFGFGCGIGRR